MYLSIPSTLTLPFVDAERRNPSGGDGKPRVSYRARFALAFAVLFVGWFVARVNGYWQ